MKATKGFFISDKNQIANIKNYKHSLFALKDLEQSVMRPQLLKVPMGPAQSFSVKHDVEPFANCRWHYHPEVELIYFNKGRGTQYVGDSVSRFEDGDLVLIGKDLPHFWRFDEATEKDKHRRNADVKVAHFSENFWGNQFLDLPENRPIKTVLERARRGIQIKGKAKLTVPQLLDKMLGAEGAERLIILMQILTEIAGNAEYTTLSSLGFIKPAEDPQKDRINDVFQFTLSNFRRKISLEEISEVAGISPNSFCRYFKSRTRKTYSQFLLEVKVGHACKLLIEDKMSIKQLCYESGFNNFASFHKYFKAITGKSPLSYQKSFIAKSESA